MCTSLASLSYASYNVEMACLRGYLLEGTTEGGRAAAHKCTVTAPNPASRCANVWVEAGEESRNIVDGGRYSARTCHYIYMYL